MNLPKCLTLLLIFFLVACVGETTPGNPDNSSSSSNAVSSISISSSRSSSSSSIATEPLQLTFVQPQNGAQFIEGTIVDVIAVAQQDDLVDYMELYVNGQLVRRESFTPWDWGAAKNDQQLSFLSPGDYRITLRATDKLGANVTKEITIRIIAQAGSSSPSSNTSSSIDSSELDFSLARFYFNQSVPVNDSDRSAEGANISLVENRPGRARAFVTRSGIGNAIVPTVTLFYKTASGGEGSFDLTGATEVPTGIIENRLDRSFDINLDAEFFAQGTQYYVQVDPDNQIAEASENNNRFPESGYVSMNIANVPRLDLVFVPVIVGNGGNDPGLNDAVVQNLMLDTMNMMPLENFDFRIRQPFTYTGSDWGELVGLMDNIRVSEDRRRYYHGVVGGRVDNSGTGGIAYLGGRAGVSIRNGSVIAHELGHNLSLRHTDCGGPFGAEPNYPYANARTGNLGFDMSTNRLMSPDRADFMSYCRQTWIGSFNYRKIFNFRGREAAQVILDDRESTESYRVISGSSMAGTVSIKRAFSVSSWAQKSRQTAHNYQIRLTGISGNVLYEEGFEMQELDHSEMQPFKVGVPEALLIEPIAEIEILHNDTVLHREDWSLGVVGLQKSRGFELNRLDELRVSIVWQADGETSLWVSDKNTGNILTIDKTGEVVVHTVNDSLQLSFHKRLSIEKLDVNIPSP